MTPTIRAPFPPDDGQAWEGQCARCGSSTYYTPCSACDGDGSVESEDYDGPYEESCQQCLGEGGWRTCISSAEWCAANPVTADAPERGVIEWFVVERGGGA